MKKILSGILAVVVAAGAAGAVLPRDITGLSVTASASELYEGVWEYDTYNGAENTVYLISYKGTDKDIVLPDKIGSRMKVVAANASLFQKLPTTVETVTIPASITTMRNSYTDLFSNLPNLKSITVDEANPVFSSKDGVFYKQTENSKYGELVSYPRGKETGDFVIPDGVELICWRAFYNRSNVTGVTMPDSLKTIGEWAFYNCSSLKSIEIPDSVTTIGDSAFSDCSSATSLRMSPNCTLENFPGARTSVFAGCSSLTKVFIPEGVTQLGNHVFASCSNLEVVSLPHSLVQMWGRSFSQYDSFAYCNKIATVYYNGTTSEYSGISIGGEPFNAKTYVQCKRDFTDEATDVTVTDGVGALPLSEDDDKDYKITVKTSNIKDGVRYNISMDDLDKAAFPMATDGTTVTVKIKVPSALSGKTITVTCDGKNIASTTADGYVTFETNKLNCNFDLTAADVKVAVEVTVKAPDDKDTSGRKVTVTGNGVDKEIAITDGQFDITDIADGSYTFTFSAKNCAPNAYEVTVSGGAVTGLEGGVKLHLLGDINGDGVVNTQDVAKANAHVKGTSTLTGYELACINVNLDNFTNVQDVALMNAHAKNTKLIW